MISHLDNSEKTVFQRQTQQVLPSCPWLGRGHRISHQSKCSLFCIFKVRNLVWGIKHVFLTLCSLQVEEFTALSATPGRDGAAEGSASGSVALPPFFLHACSFVQTERSNTILRTPEQHLLVGGRGPRKVREIESVSSTVTTEEGARLWGTVGLGPVLMTGRGKPAWQAVEVARVGMVFPVGSLGTGLLPRVRSLRRSLSFLWKAL